MTGQPDRWIKRITTGCVALLALIAGTVSYLHMHTLVALHGQPGWVATLTPLSVDGMIVAASTTLLADSRSGDRGGILPWTLLVVGSVASLAANVAVAEPTLVGRVIAAWPSFALTASYELLTREVRRSTAADRAHEHQSAEVLSVHPTRVKRGSAPGDAGHKQDASGDLQRQAWQWALANRGDDGALPTGEAIARAHGRQERWGRLIKNAGLTGAFGDEEPQLVVPQFSTNSPADLDVHSLTRP